MLSPILLCVQLVCPGAVIQSPPMHLRLCFCTSIVVAYRRVSARFPIERYSFTVIVHNIDHNLVPSLNLDANMAPQVILTWSKYRLIGPSEARLMARSSQASCRVFATRISLQT